MFASCARAAMARLRSNAALTASSAARSGRQQQRNYASGSGGGHGDDHGVTFEGVTLHKPARWHAAIGSGMASLMWFWIFYRCYHDGETLLFGHAPHFEHDDHHHGDGEEGGHGKH